MRFFILLISLLFTCPLSNAQRLNHQGKKMVRSVKCFVPNKKDTIKYNFYYNDECRLIRMDRLRNNSQNYGRYLLRNRLEYKDGKLQRTDYDEYGYKKTKFIYSYVLDSDRYVVERTFKDVSGTDKWYLKEVTRFTYDYPYKDDIRQIVRETHYSYIGELIKGKRVEKEVVGDRYSRFYNIIGGNTYSKGRNEKYACEYDDLNINICYLYDNFYDIERVTEWYNFHSECLLERQINGFSSYHYYFTDSEPYNLIRVEDIGDNNKVYEIYLIDYVY